MNKLKLTKRDYHGRNVKQRIQKIIDDTRECRKKIKTGIKLPETLSWNEAKRLYNEFDNAKVYINDIYQVLYYDEKMVDNMGCSSETFKEQIRYLSIKRHDKEAVKDWRDFQDIKNQLCGEDSEAVELFPSESRLVDTANQYHLWVFPKGYILPFGMIARAVIEDELDGEGETAKQRARID
jgi:hypothetical protein